MTQEVPQIPKGRKSTIITLYTSEIYIIYDKTPDEVGEIVANSGDWVRMPNGARIRPNQIALMQDYQDYRFQTEQKVRHKQGYYIQNGKWFDKTGYNTGMSAELERITGILNEKLLPGRKPLTINKQEDQQHG